MEINANLRIINGKHGLTTAFEFLNEKSFKANVMVSDIGDNINFGPDRINSEDDLKILKNADGVIVVNWASNSKGTQLTNMSSKIHQKLFTLLTLQTLRPEKRISDLLSNISDIIDILSIMKMNVILLHCCRLRYPYTIRQL